MSSIEGQYDGDMAEYEGEGGPSEIIAMCGGYGMGKDPSPNVVHAFLQRLAEAIAGVPPLVEGVIRSEATKLLADAGVRGPGRLVSAALRAEEVPTEHGTRGRELQGRAISSQRPAPWHEPVDGAALLTDIVQTIKAHLALTDEAAICVALWILHAHVHQVLKVSPILTITSPQKRCGKTTLLILISCIVPVPLYASSITTASLFRVVEAYYPTLLIDEADAFLGGKEELRGVLNSGHLRPSAHVVRTAGDDHEPRQYSTWSPKALAAIGSVPGTIADRSVIIEMRRRAPDEKVARLRLDRLEQFEPLRQKAARWAEDHQDRLIDHDPVMPNDLNDRASDNFRPLIAIADEAGGEWPALARMVAIALSGSQDDGDLSDAIQLLADVREIFLARGTDRLSSRDLRGELVHRLDRPWPEYHEGLPLTDRQMAKLLKPFRVQPKKVRIGDEVMQGYMLPALADAFARYLPVVSPAEHPEHSSANAENR